MQGIQAEDNIRDREGLLVTGNSWVVAKSLGQWGIDGGVYEWETAMQGSYHGGLYTTASATAGFVNQYLNLGLQCISNPAAPGGSSSGGSGGSGNGSSMDDAITAMNEFLERGISGPTAPPKPFFEIMEAMHGDIATAIDGYDHDTDVPWWPANEVTHIFVFPVSLEHEIIGDPIQMSKHLLVNADGTINNYSLTLNQGLYVAKLFIPDHGFVEAYFESESNSVQSFPLTNYLTAEIYPVPLSADQNLTVLATTTFSMSYEYTLTDAHGNILEQKNIRARANEEQKFIFNSNSLPTGQLFHRFAFSDGSEVIYNTIKM
jgi:hypothetical protein